VWVPQLTAYFVTHLRHVAVPIDCDDQNGARGSTWVYFGFTPSKGLSIQNTARFQSESESELLSHIAAVNDTCKMLPITGCEALVMEITSRPGLWDADTNPLKLSNSDTDSDWKEE
jgi:hypothetical protein